MKTFLTACTLTLLLLGLNSPLQAQSEEAADAVQEQVIATMEGMPIELQKQVLQFAEARKQAYELNEQRRKDAANREKKVAQLQEFIDRFRYNASKAAQVQSRIKKLDKIELVEVGRQRVDPGGGGQDHGQRRSVPTQPAGEVDPARTPAEMDVREDDIDVVARLAEHVQARLRDGVRDEYLHARGESGAGINAFHMGTCCRGLLERAFLP